MFAQGGASVSSLHLPLLPTQIYAACLHLDFMAEAHCWEAWLDLPWSEVGKERGREGGRMYYDPCKEEQRRGRQLGGLPNQALNAIDKSCPV